MELRSKRDIRTIYSNFKYELLKILRDPKLKDNEKVLAVYDIIRLHEAIK